VSSSSRLQLAGRAVAGGWLSWGEGCRCAGGCGERQKIARNSSCYVTSDLAGC
jgi:hypothetical protein